MEEKPSSNGLLAQADQRRWHDVLLFFGLYSYGISCPFSISLSQISLGIAFIGLLAGFFKGGKRPKTSNLERPFFCLFFAGLFSILFAHDPRLGLREMKKFLIILVFWIPYWGSLNISFQRRILGLIICFGALSSAAGIIKNFFLEGSHYRVSAFFSMPLTFGECQMLFILSTVAWLHSGEENRLTRKLLWSALVFQCIGLTASFTRGAFIGLGLGFFSIFKFSAKKLMLVIFSIVIVLVGINAFGFFFQRKDVFSFSSENPDSLSNIRLKIWRNGLNILKENPVFGVGMNNVKHYYRQRVTKFEAENNQVFGHLHNNFLQFLVMTGFFGYLVFWWFVIATLQFCRKLPQTISHPWQSRLSGHSIGLWLAFLGSGFTEYSFGDEEVAMLCFFLMGLFATPSGNLQQTEEFSVQPNHFCPLQKMPQK